MRWKLWLPLAGAALAVAFAVSAAFYCRQPDGNPSEDESFPLPEFSKSPYLNTGPDAEYVGTTACKECHSSKYESYLHTAHSRAMSDVSLPAEPPDGAFE